MLSDAELLSLAIEMRKAQNDFYRHGRSQPQLAIARDLERRFDREVQERKEARGGRTNSMF